MIILVSFADFFLSFCVHISFCLISFSFQELDLSPEALLRNDSNREEPWTDLVESSLKMAGKFTQVSSCVYEATFEIYFLSFSPFLSSPSSFNSSLPSLPLPPSPLPPSPFSFPPLPSPDMYSKTGRYIAIGVC